MCNVFYRRVKYSLGLKLNANVVPSLKLQVTLHSSLLAGPKSDAPTHLVSSTVQPVVDLQTWFLYPFTPLDLIYHLLITFSTLDMFS